MWLSGPLPSLIGLTKNEQQNMRGRVDEALRKTKNCGVFNRYEYLPSNVMIFIKYYVRKRIFFLQSVKFVNGRARIQKIVTETRGARGSHPDSSPPPIRGLSSRPSLDIFKRLLSIGRVNDDND